MPSTVMTLRKQVIPAFLVAVILLVTGHAPVQAQDAEGLTDGEAIENTIVGRDIALRIRMETVFSEDDNGLIDEDIEYARFPTAINSAEAKIFQNDGASLSTTYSLWQNHQNLDHNRWSWKARVPIQTSDFLDVTEQPPYFSFMYRYMAGDTNSPDRQYLTLGYDQYPVNSLYVAVQYRAGMDEGQFSGHQVSEYLSWKISDIYRIGEMGAVSKNMNTDDVTPWFGQVFGTVFLVKDWTAVRIDARHYQVTDELSYQDYNAYLYQRAGSNTLLRLNYRHYMDSEGFMSDAVGLKVKHYFSPSFAVHVGYRYYNHAKGANIITYYAGLNLIL